MKFKELVLLAEDTNDDEDVLAGMETYEKENRPVYVATYENCRGLVETNISQETVGTFLDEMYDAEGDLEYYKEFSPEGIPDTKQEALDMIINGKTFVFGGEESISYVSINLENAVNGVRDELGEWTDIEDNEDLQNFEEQVAQFKQEHGLQ